MTDSEYLIKLANQTPYNNVPEIKEHCDRLKKIAEHIKKLEKELDKHDSTWRQFIDLE